MEGYAILLASEELEKVHMAGMMASVAAISEIPVDVYVTMNALTSFEKKTVENEDYACGRVGEAMLASEEVESPMFYEQLEQAKTLGEVNVYACTFAMDVLDNDLDDYIDVFDDDLGVSGFLGRTDDKEILVM